MNCRAVHDARHRQCPEGRQQPLNSEPGADKVRNSKLIDPPLKIAVRNDQCTDCGFCKYFTCSWGNECTGCGACVLACPNRARELTAKTAAARSVRVTIDGIERQVPAPATVLKALEISGYRIARHHDAANDVTAPCGTGACGECSVLVDGELKPSCVTPVGEGMQIITDPERIRKLPPRRIVSVLTRSIHPSTAQYGIRENSFFLHGCNLNCPACHNWDVTFSAVGQLSTPEEILQPYLAHASKGHIDRIGISGGEATLNRRWLVEFIGKLARNVGPPTRIQLDTNASLLDPDYIETLLAAGVSDISPDIKALNIKTFQRVTGMTDRRRAERYLQTSWQAVEYLATQCAGRVLLVVGVPYHPDLMEPEELAAIGARLASFSPSLPVNLIEYQAAFRNRALPLPTLEQSRQALRRLQTAGLERVWCQSAREMPLPKDPEDLLVSESWDW